MALLLTILILNLMFKGIGEIFTGVGMVTGPAIGGFLYGVKSIVLLVTFG